MRHRSYSFESTWRLAAPPTDCWRLIEDVICGRSDAWRGLRIVRPVRAVESGSTAMLEVRSPVGYRLRITVTLVEVEPGRQMSAVSDGDLAGSGTVRLAADGDGDRTIVRIRWSVETTRPWMNRTAPVLAPVFRVAHAIVMRRGARAASEAVRATASVRDSEVRNAVNPRPEDGGRPTDH